MGATTTDRESASTGEPSGAAAQAPRDGAAAAAAQPGRGGLSLATRLAVSVVGVAILALMTGTVVVLTGARDLTDDSRRDALRALLAHQTDAVERAFVNRRDGLVAVAGAATVADAAARLADGYAQLEPEPGEVADATDRLEAAYRSQLVPDLEAVTGEAVRAESLLPVADAARVLQAAYGLPAPGAPSADPPDAEGNPWAVVHGEVDPRFDVLVERLGFADLYIVDAATGRIVYSTGKAPDFATSLDVGPFSGSLLARVVAAVLAQPDAGVQMSDVAPYAPFGGRPTGFLAAPVSAGTGPPTAVLAAAYTTAPIDDILTAGAQWREYGFGESGETFLIGPDGGMRTIARGFAENPDLYLSAVEASTTDNERAAIAATGTTATFQRAVTPDDVGEAVASQPFPMTDPLGEQVLAAYEPVDLPGFGQAPQWRVVAQIAQQEIAGPLDALDRRTFAAVTVGTLLATFFSVWWSRRVFRPVRAVSERLRRVRRRDPDPPVQLPRDAAAEFAELHGRVDQLVAALDRQQAEVRAALARRQETIRSVLPAAVADRFLAGDRRVVDEIAQASVVVLVTDGAGEVVKAAPDGGRNLLGRMVGTLDRLAEEHGLGRVKLVGHAYFAACGLEQPHLDHAMRAVRFAAAARDAVREVTAEGAPTLEIAAGVASGPVTVGLAGSALLVYDLWGETADRARSLAQRAVPGEILVSARTHDILPPHVRLTARATPDGEVRVLTGIGTEERVAP